jgi:hypothetical protein
MPLAMAAVRVVMDSISPIIFRQTTQGERFGDPRPYGAVIARQEQVHLRHRREIHALPRAVAGTDQVKIFFQQRLADDAGHRRTLIEHRHIQLARQQLVIQRVPLLSCR